MFTRCLYNKQNITCPLVDMNFIFSCSTRYLTRSLRSLVRYRVEHSKIKFISTRGHVISSIYCMRAVQKVEVHQTVFCIKQTNPFFMDCLSNEWCFVLPFRFGLKEVTNHQMFCFFCPVRIGFYVACTCFPTLRNSDVFLVSSLIGSFFSLCLWTL